MPLKDPIARKAYQQARAAQMTPEERLELNARNRAWYAASRQDRLEKAQERRRARGVQPKAPAVDKSCQQCGQAFRVKASHAARRLYCSDVCWKAAIATPYTTIICQRCGRSFERPTALVRSQGVRYCSKDCEYPPVLERFWSYVKICPHPPYCLYCCWEWQGTMNSYGYGMFSIKHEPFMAHRVSWELHNNCSIPQGSLREICQHLCHNPGCVNPWHLSLSSQKENLLESFKSNRFTRMYKLSKEDVQLIRSLAAEGISYRTLAAQFHIHVKYVGAIVRRKSWKRLP